MHTSYIDVFPITAVVVHVPSIDLVISVTFVGVVGKLLELSLET